ncbi:hypothetical protein BN130_2822 [Cronobacter malonaticus 507]|nr:hypothetical protein BN130_2822 [Cronobacter malonaticus 507]
MKCAAALARPGLFFDLPRLFAIRRCSKVTPIFFVFDA